MSRMLNEKRAYRNQKSGMMGRGPCTFRQRDLTRAIRGALAAGLVVERAWIEIDGRIMLGFAAGGAGRPAETEQDCNPWDKALAS
jgi:hypothetical protein